MVHPSLLSLGKEGIDGPPSFYPDASSPPPDEREIKSEKEREKERKKERETYKERERESERELANHTN